jgi:hypothetical protein
VAEKTGEKFGDLLVKSGLIDQLQLQAALGHQRRWGGKLGQCLIDLGFITESELLAFMTEKFKIPAIDLAKSKISAQAFASVPEMVAKKYGVVPVFLKEGPGKKKTLTLAMSDPTNLKVLDEVQFLTGFKVEPVLAVESTISKVLEHYGHLSPGDLDEKLRPDIARPLDLRKPAPAKPEAAPQEPEREVEVVLGGEQPTDDMEEIKDLVEAESEGVEITSDEDIKVIKDEVVMVKAEGQRPKPKVGSTTERLPSRAPIREKLKSAPGVESYQPEEKPPETPAVEPAPQSDFLKVPDLSLVPPDLGPAPEAQAKLEKETAIDIPEDEPEEKMEIASAHEFVGYEGGQQQPEPAEAPPNPEDLEPGPAEPVKTAAPVEPPQQIKEPVPEQELTRMVKPQSADDDFWSEHEHAVIKPKPGVPAVADDEESLPFERAFAPAPQPAAPAQPVKKDMEYLDEYSDNNVQVAGQLTQPPKPVAVEQSEEFHKTPPELKDLAAEASGEMSLEFAFHKINQLESEVKQREFQFDELINLMMKKETGEITTELFMNELAIIKAEMEKKKGK